MEFRIEKDTMGEVKVPAQRYWGAKLNVRATTLKLAQRLVPLKSSTLCLLEKSGGAPITPSVFATRKKRPYF
jgi:fumarate hydratase class II